MHLTAAVLVSASACRDVPRPVGPGSQRIAQLHAKRPKPAQKPRHSRTPVLRPLERHLGGEANIENSRTVSAPYLSTIVCGSTPLFFDFDIFSMRRSRPAGRRT
jgi:hypothetical protein